MVQKSGWLNIQAAYYLPILSNHFLLEVRQFNRRTRGHFQKLGPTMFDKPH